MTIAACALLLPASAQAHATKRFFVPAAGTAAVLAWLPPGTTVGQLAAAGFAPGLMSAGLGTVPPEQTYLDVGQGNRVFDSLYGESLRPLGESACEPWLEAARQRAESAPSEIEPGLLVEELWGGQAAVIAYDGPTCELGIQNGTGLGPDARGVFRVGSAALKRAQQLVRQAHRSDLVIAIARPTGRSDAPLPIGVAGSGFDGDLTSDSTRLDGYVLSTDVAPTILDHFGIEVPSQMSGQPIRSEGSVDVAGIESLGARMAVISHRRGPVIGLSLLAWLLVAVLAIALSRGAWARPTVRLLGLAVVYLPLVLLAGAALEPGEGPETLLVALGAPALAALTLAALRDYRALAVAAGLTVLAYAADMIAGSPLTALSLLGPNPELGVRFYGIGNELEALLAVLVVGGIGAGLAGFAPRAGQRRSAIAFLAIGLVAALIFAAGRFGADVGAAIVFPVGAVVAAVTVAGRRRHAVLLVVAVPFAILALLALIDLLSGANAHLTRSVLDAGGLRSLGDVAQRRLQLSVDSFGRPILLAFLPLLIALVALAVWQRDLISSWVQGRPAMRAALLGAVVATVVGTLANDSGALLLEIGAAYLLVFLGWAWTESRTSAPKA